MKVGDVVVLKSGGPAMTVVHVADSGSQVTCMWFGGSYVRQDYFDPQCLIVKTTEQ